MHSLLQIASNGRVYTCAAYFLQDFHFAAPVASSSYQSQLWLCRAVQHNMITRQHSRAFIFATAVLSFAVVLGGVPMFVQAQSIAASEAATATAKAKLEAATAAQNAGKKKFPVTREDMVVAMPVDQAHLAIAHASRVWRKVPLSLNCYTSLLQLSQLHSWFSCMQGS